MEIFLFVADTKKHTRSPRETAGAPFAAREVGPCIVHRPSLGPAAGWRASRPVNPMRLGARRATGASADGCAASTTRVPLARASANNGNRCRYPARTRLHCLVPRKRLLPVQDSACRACPGTGWMPEAPAFWALSLPPSPAPRVVTWHHGSRGPRHWRPHAPPVAVGSARANLARRQPAPALPASAAAAAAQCRATAPNGTRRLQRHISIFKSHLPRGPSRREPCLPGRLAVFAR